MVKSQPVWSLPLTLASVLGLRIEKIQWVLDVLELVSHTNTQTYMLGGEGGGIRAPITGRAGSYPPMPLCCRTGFLVLSMMGEGEGGCHTLSPPSP